MSDIDLYYFFENGKVERMKCDKNLSVSEFIQKVKNYFKNSDELEDERKPYSPPDLEDIRCAFLKGQKLQDNDLLKNHIDDLQKCPLFLSNDPTKSYEYNFTHIDLDDYENIQFHSKYSYEFDFKATEKKTKKEVFIKVYDESLRVEDFYTNLQRLNVASALKHPGTVQIQYFRYPLNDQEKKQTKLLKIECKDERGETVEVDVTGFILIFEFMKNGSIEYAVSEYLITGGQNQDKMNPTIRSKIIFGIASTMKIIHQKNAIHRDLKLENIYFDENFEPRIGGFGLPKFMGDNLSIRTPIYMAPELFMDGDETYGTSVDVYAYAFILYKMFSNKITFDGPKQPRSPQQYLMYISRGKRPKRPENIPDHYWDLINKCWAEDPSKRPTFEEIVETLKSDKYAIEEFGMKTDLDELHNYQDHIEQYEKLIESLNK